MLAALILLNATAAPSLDYHVVARPAALTVEARLSDGGRRFAIEDGLGSFVRDLEVEARDGWHALAMSGDQVDVPACATSCRLRYRVLLAEAARAVRDYRRALDHGGALVAPPSSWLLRPQNTVRGVRWRLRVEAAEGARFVTGLFPGRDGSFEAGLDDLPESPYSAIGALEVEDVSVPGGRVQVVVAPGARIVERPAILEWVRRAVAAVTSVYGRFPVPHALVLVLPGGRRPVGFGTTLGNGGASILIWIGASATEEHLRRDWVLTHEMLHLGFPNLPRAHRWLEEGLATYLEPLARARMGQLAEQAVWEGLVRGMPKGLPDAADGGLDATRDWGRTYWGGALFCLLADVEIRQRTGGRRSLDDALRGILAEGGTIATRVSLEQAISVGDRATGVPVLRGLHARHGPQPAPVELDALWSRLGVRRQEGQVSFDDAAPLAWVRRALTQAPRASR